MHDHAEPYAGVNGSGAGRPPFPPGEGGAPAPAGGPRNAPTPRRRPTPRKLDAGKVQARLLRAVDRQVAMIDARLAETGAEIEERDSRILGNLAKTLSTLMEIGEGGKTSKDREPPERDDAEDRLAERIKKWARGGE